MTTARDVAQAAGVSVSTVSRALSRPNQVAPETRKLVIDNADLLGYRPHTTARVDARRRTGNVGLVSPDLENPFFASIAKGAQKRANTHGWRVFIADTDEDAGEEFEVVSTFAQQVDGVVLCSPRCTTEELATLAELTSLVLVGREAPGIPSVTVAYDSGMRQAVTHLAALGHSRIAYIGGPAMSWTQQQRLRGLNEARELHPGVEIVDLGSFRPVFSGGEAAADLAVASGATATIAFNNLMALGVLDRLRTRGIEVYRDMSLIGFDDIFVATLVSPAITTVGLSLRRIGREAMDLLDSLVTQPGQLTANRSLDMELIVRESTGQPRP